MTWKGKLVVVALVLSGVFAGAIGKDGFMAWWNNNFASGNTEVAENDDRQKPLPSPTATVNPAASGVDPTSIPQGSVPTTMAQQLGEQERDYEVQVRMPSQGRMAGAGSQSQSTGSLRAKKAPLIFKKGKIPLFDGSILGTDVKEFQVTSYELEPGGAIIRFCTDRPEGVDGVDYCQIGGTKPKYKKFRETHNQSGTRCYTARRE